MSTYDYATITGIDHNGVEQTVVICTYIPDGKGINESNIIIEEKDEKEEKEKTDEVQ